MNAVRGAGIGPALARFVRARWKQLVLLFGGVLAPLLAFADLASDVWRGGIFSWDAPVLRYAHSFATPALDTAMIVVSAAGYSYGVIPGAALIFVLLLLRRRRGDALFFAVAIVGAGVLNQSAKMFFQRARPDLWLSPAPEHTYSFPSGHAMGSMALAAALAVLAWPTRGRWPAIVLGAAFTFLVGLSRVYLGVHYPSDVVAGWAASLAWVLGVSIAAYGRAGKPADRATPVAAGRDPEPSPPAPSPDNGRGAPPLALSREGENFHSGHPMSQPSAILFDLDGTLIDTFRLYLESYRRALAPYLGRDVTDAEIVARRPSAERRFLEEWVGAEHIDACHSAMCGHYGELHRAMSDGPYEGVREMLAALRSAGLPLGIVTGKGRRAWEVTEAELALGPWAAVVTEDDAAAPKPHPGGLLTAAGMLGLDPRDIVYVGDSAGDMEAGHAAGMRTAAALWAKTEPGEADAFLEQIAPHSPDWAFHRPSDLTRTFAAWC